MDELLEIQNNLRRYFTRKADLLEETLKSKNLELHLQKLESHLKYFLSAFDELKYIDQKILLEMRKQDYTWRDREKMRNSIAIYEDRYMILKRKTLRMLEELKAKEGVEAFLKILGKAGLMTFAVLGGVAIGVPALGFGSGGVVAGSMAAAYQSSVLGGTIASGSMFATLQSIGAAGLAASTKLAVFAGSAAAATIHKIFK